MWVCILNQTCMTSASNQDCVATLLPQMLHKSSYLQLLVTVLITANGIFTQPATASATHIADCTQVNY